VASSTRHASRPQAVIERPSVPERAAAMVSIACLAAALLVLALNAVLRIGAVALALAGLLGCVTACWYAVARRGVVRILSGLAAASRSAMAKAAAKEAATAGLDGSAPVLIMNLKSGDGKARQCNLAEECVSRGIRPVVLQHGDDLIALAREAVASGASAIGMAGGDGSQAAVASVAASQGVPYVCVPAGTRNHFALDLGLDRADVVGALDAYADQVERQVDLAEVTAGHS
jgi:hypothetical protein